MEQKIDELLVQLHKYLFADSEQVVNELRIYLLDDSLREADLAFISSKIFNSKDSFLEFLRQNAQQNEKLISSVKKKIYELIIDFLKQWPREVSGYLQQIKDTCLLSFRSDSNSLVKESSLQLLIKIIETFEHSSREIDTIIKPKDMIIMLLDEIKLRRPSASVKGAIWTLVGLLHEKYPTLNEFRIESQDVMFIQLNEQMKSEKPEIKAIQGIMKGFVHSLAGDKEECCTLDDDQLENMFVLLKIAMQPIEDMQNKGVMKSAMKLFGTHIHLFKKQVLKQAIDLVTNNLKLCIHENMEVRDGANELLGKLMGEISDGLTTETVAHRETFRQIQAKFQEILEDPNHLNVLLISTIKAVGIFSKAIITFMGEPQLEHYLERLVEVSEIKIIKEFEQQEDPKNDYKNFKQILKKQKQLISFIESYSFILSNLKSKPPTEPFLLHFFKVCSIGVRHHRKLYAKYRVRLYEAFANFIMSLAHHKTAFIQFTKKFVRYSLTETLKIPDAVIFGGESPFESLQDAVQFWRDFLSKDKIWTEFTCSHVYDELLQIILDDIDKLNLTYKVEKAQSSSLQNVQANSGLVMAQQKQQRLDADEDINPTSTIIQYIANNNADQQYLVRLSNFVEMFLLECKDEWFLRWIPQYCSILIKKASQTPRISKLYALLKTSMIIASKFHFFEIKEEGFKGEKLNTYNMLLTFFKELIGKQEEYQDELLTSCLDLLLHVPVPVLYSKQGGAGAAQRVTDNIYLWKAIMLKALHIGLTQSNQLAMNSITMLEQWFNTLPFSVTVDLYKDILPKLSDFLHIDDEKAQKKAAKSAKTQEDFQYQEMLKSGIDNVVIERKDIANKVLNLLGKLGGHAHSIINNAQTKLHEKEHFIKWDPERRLKFTVPLFTTKVDIYFDSCLPKLVDLALNAIDRETRIAACEFLHALMIYMIGKNATQPKVGGRNKNGGDPSQKEEMAPFAKIYQKLFPVIIRLASETEQIARTLFEPLIFQIVRWFSSSRVYEHPEVESLLDALIEGASSRNNSALRELCSNAVAEFAKWSLKQMTDKDIKENPNNIQSLLRRIESNSNHPDPFKRLSAVLCFNKIFAIIREFDPLVDRFCMEIAHSVLGSLKMCHNSLEFSQEVIDNCTRLLDKIQKVMVRKSALLMQPNPKRSQCTNFFLFIQYLFKKFISVETVCRRESMKLWEALVKNLPPKNEEGMPDTPAAWILEYYPKSREGGTSIFTSLQRISFEEKKDVAGMIDTHTGPQGYQAGRTIKFSERQKQLDQLTAQLECFEFLLSRNFCQYQDIIEQLQVDQKVWFGNIQSLIHDHVVPKYHKLLASVNKSSEKLYICKEDKEGLTKSKITLITQLFKYMLSLDDRTLMFHLKHLENDNFKLIEFVLQIILAPMIHQLQLLVEDQDLERQLRSQCEKLIQRLLSVLPKQASLLTILQEKIIDQLKMLNLDKLTPKNVNQYPPKLLMQMCVGYLKLAQLDQSGEFRDFLIAKRHALSTVVEEWLQGETPLENESSRVLVKFLSKLEIPNQVLCNWLTVKYEVYQKTSDLLLQYIADNWSHEKLRVGEYLITKAAEEGYDKIILGVFLPILEIVQAKASNYQTTLLTIIPREWARPQQDYDAALNQVRIYSFITNNCRHLLQDTSNKTAGIFIDHLCHTASIYLQDRFSVHLKKEVLNLIGLIYNMKTSRGEYVHVRLNDSLINVRSQFFPIKSRELAKNSFQQTNFNVIIEAFLNLLLLSKNLKVLRLLYGIIREPKTSFEPSLRRTLNIIITQVINKLPLAQFKTTVNEFFEEFFDPQTDTSIDDNLRWCIMNKIISVILETCKEEYLAEIMIDYTKRFEEILKKPFTQHRDDPLAFYLSVREKSHIFLCFEIMFRRLKADTIRTLVHKRVYGPESQGKEITVFLISQSVAAKKGPIEGFLLFTKDHIKTEFDKLNSPQQVQRIYICSAFSCLNSIIMTTQTKEDLFSKFLFVQNRDKGEEQSIWSLIVDSEQSFNFEVETNFTYVQLKNIEMKIDQAYNNTNHSKDDAKMSSADDKRGDISLIKANNLISEYVNSSFMSANEKFNSAMVFETQPDQINMRKEEEKLQKFLTEKTSVQNGEEEPEVDSMGNQIQEVDESQLELDNVNQHECMKNIKRCIDKMVELFSSSQWEKDRTQMPLFMQALNAEIRKPEVHLNVKIFILKILINNPNLFAPYAQYWFEPIATYIIEKNNGGKGFHYFIRDLCTLLISWSYFTPDENVSKNKLLCTNVINTLAKYSADKAKMIFNTNIQIVASLVHKWRKLIAFNKDTLAMMINMDDKKEGSNLWKMTGIQILALAVAFDVPILEKPEQITQLQPNQRCFKLQDPNEAKQCDKVLEALLKIQYNKKKQIIQAASETLGKILAKQPSLVWVCLPALLSNENNERHDVLVNSIEKVSREFPELLKERKIFMKLLSFVKVLTGTMRAAVLKTFERYLTVCRRLAKLEDINEIARALQADSDEILADISDENQQAFISLLTQLSKLNIDQGDDLLKKVLPRLKSLFVNLKNDYSRGLFYDMMVFLYDQLEHLRPFGVKTALIRGLSDKSKVIRDKLTAFWSDPARLSLDPKVRIEQLMDEQMFYSKEEEHIWVNNAVYLLMQISSKSSDYDRKIFDQPLQNCKFTPLEIHNYYNAVANLQRSQPLTPLFSQQMMMFQASQQALQDMIKKEQQHQLAPIPEIPDSEAAGDQGPDVEMIDTTAATSNRPQKPNRQQPAALPTSSSQQILEISDTQAHNLGGFIRATQVPIFTQTQSELSSLIATNFMHSDSSPPQQQQITDSLTASFYEVNKMGGGARQRGAQKRQQVITFNTGSSPPQDIGGDGDDVFIAPQAKKKHKNDLRKFFGQNEFFYKPSESQGQKLRFISQGQMPMHLAKKEEIRKMQSEQFFNRQVDRMKKSVGLYRKYRVGELPDIQINFKDVLLPLMALTKSDITIATEVFVEVFSQIYQSLNEKEARVNLGSGVKNVLSSSILYDYGCINCLHRVAMELLKIDGFTLNANVIQRTGQHSMSFQTALVLLEESIIHGSDIHDQDYKQTQQQVKRRRGGAEAQKKTGIAGYNFVQSSLSEGNRKYWFNMINLYETVANEDALLGIWSFIADDEGIIFKKQVQQEDGKLSQDQEQAVNLIKEANRLKNKGSIAEGLKVLEQTLNDPKINEYLEEHIKLELQNKRLESKAELLKWDDIAKELTSSDLGRKQLKDIPYLHADKMIKAQIRVDKYWANLSKQVEFWTTDEVSKAYLDKNFNYEMALISVTCKDFDRARFYIDRETTELLTKWKHLTKLSQVAQHILVQKIQKIYEMKEFLENVKNDGVMTKQQIVPHVLKSLQTWTQRVPNSAFDSFSVWDDILTSRSIFLDMYDFCLKSEFTNALFNNSNTKHIGAILQVQCAKGSFKMGLYDTSDRYLKRALHLREESAKKEGGSDSTLNIIIPIIKLKSQQFKANDRNMQFQSQANELSKILGVLDKKLRENVQAVDARLGGHVEDSKIEIKGLMLKQQLEKKGLDILLEQVREERDAKQMKQLEEGVSLYLSKNFSTFKVIQEKVKAAAQFDDTMKNTMAKTYYKFAQFTDKILRKMEHESQAVPLKKSLTALKKSEEELAKMTIKNGLLALNLEYSKASDIIPRMLDVVSKYKEHVEGEFIAHSKDTPAWFFLRWINQIVAIVNRQESSVIEQKVIQIAARYPQALYYPFKVIESNIQVNVLGSDIQLTPLFRKLKVSFAKQFGNLNAWSEALDCLVYPEHRFKYWYQIIQDMLQSSDAAKQMYGDKLKEVVKMMLKDIAVTEKGMVGDQIGNYNRKFADKYGRYLQQELYKNGKIDKLTAKQVSTVLAKVLEQIQEGTLGSGYEKLSTFSEWLDNLDNSDFYNPYEYIELPGQYEGLMSEPVIQKNVKIASVRKTILILASIRRPKRITVHGSNEKDYHLLVKGGEDLRLDQRVQQLFQIMNTIFSNDSACMNRDLHIKTFNVVPITNRLGVLEWVDNTEPMKSIINREHMRIEGGKDLNESRALGERRKWLKSIQGSSKAETIAEQHLQLLGIDEKRVVEGFNNHKAMMPWYLLRNGLENLCLTSSAFLAIKNQFIRSLATFSVASYLIGIGDRHLENFLIDTTDGEVLGIDFGIAFGSAVHLGIPELMPFRLTQQIEGVIAPHPLEGVYKQTMVHSLQALRKKKSLILDTCEIFVKEPLLDWVKDAKQRQASSSTNAKHEPDSVIPSMMSEYEEELQELQWYPRKKIEIVKQKLHGCNPVKIVKVELKDSKHEKRQYCKVLKAAIEGGEDSIRQQFLKSGKKYLEVDEQIDCLIEQARDPNILGRTWIGWGPYQ